MDLNEEGQRFKITKTTQQAELVKEKNVRFYLAKNKYNK